MKYPVVPSVTILLIFHLLQCILFQIKPFNWIHFVHFLPKTQGYICILFILSMATASMKLIFTTTKILPT